MVVLRVSLHCKGCEGKVRKHISKMEGETPSRFNRAAVLYSSEKETKQTSTVVLLLLLLLL